MSVHVRVLLLVVCALALAGRAGAAPPPLPQHAPHVYKCCRESSADTFKDAVNVNSLQACKVFCEKAKYGAPVWRSAGWGCVEDTLFHSCDEVQHSRCDDMAQAVQDNLYRMYALTSSENKVITIQTGRRRNDSSQIDLKDDSRTDLNAVVIGGTQAGFRRSRVGGKLTITASEQVKTNTTQFVGRNHNSKPNGTSNDLFDLGENGAVVFERISISRGGSRRTVSDRRSIDNTKEKKDREFNLGILGILQDRSLRVGKKETEELNIQNNTNNATLEKTTVDSDGTTRVKLDKLVGFNTAVSTPGGAARRASRTRGGSSRRGTGFIERFTGFTFRTSGRTSRRSDNGRSSSTTTIDDVSGNERVIANTNGTSDGRTDRTRVETNVGSVEQTNNRTSGAAQNVTASVTSIQGQKKITKTNSCPGCKGKNNEVIDRTGVRRDVVQASSRFNRTGQLTDTKARKGKSLRLIGEVGTSVNGTVLRRQEDGVERRERDGTSKAGCKKGSKKCNFNSSNSGVTIIKSNNDSTVEEDVIVSTKRISTATFRL